MFRKTLQINDSQIKFAGNNATFTGYASVFNGVDSYGDTILPGAFKKVIASGRMPKMFENHKSWELPIGKWLTIEEDTKGLLVEGEFTPNHQRAEMVRAAMLHGTLDGLSIGFRMTSGDFDEEKGRRTIKNITELVEISPVTVPADEAARVDLTSVKSELELITNEREIENFLREAGGFSKGLAVAVTARMKQVFGGEPQKRFDEETAKQLKRLLNTPSLLG